MAQTKIIQLPDSGETCTIKTYVPHKVSRSIQEIFLGDRKIKASDPNFTGEIEISGKDAIRFNDILVEGLTIQFGSHSANIEPLAPFLDELSQDDFNILVAECSAVWQKTKENSDPKELPTGNKDTSQI